MPGRFPPPKVMNEEELEALTDQLYPLNDEAIRRYQEIPTTDLKFDEVSVKNSIMSILGSYYVPHFGQMTTSDELEQIVSVGFFLSKNHVFSDANKRTALLAIDTMLRMFGYTPPTDSKEEKYAAIQDTFEAGKTRDEALSDFIEWYRQRTIPPCA